MSDVRQRDGSQFPDRVLIISDIPERARRLSEALEPMGRPVIHASSDDASLYGSLGNVAVIVVDGDPPAAFDAASIIRSRHDPPTTPLVVVGDEVNGVVSSLMARERRGVAVIPSSASSADLLAIVSLLADLSVELRGLAQQVERQTAVLDAQQAVVRSLVGGESDEAVLPRMARTIALRFGWDVSIYWMTDGAEPRCVSLWLDTTVSVEASERLEAVARSQHGDSLVHRARASNMLDWALLTDLERDPFIDAAVSAGLESALAVPITVGSGRSGLIELLSRSADRPERQTLGALGSVAVLIGRVLDAWQAHDEAQTLKNEFFALVSHELLTPLTSILGYLEEMIADDAPNLSPAQRQDLEIIDRNAQRLNQLLHNLILAAQIEAGDLSLNLVSVDMRELVEDVVEASRWLARRRNIEIDLRAAPVQPVHGDLRRLGQVVDNLISNAVKFSHDGDVVEVALAQSGDDVVLEVADSGVGIPVAERHQVFDPYFRSSLGIANETPGVGMGLTISKAIVEAHGGSIRLESRDGPGCTFRVHLPSRDSEVVAGSTTTQEMCDE